MQIIGKDADEPGHINSKISYSIVSQEPEPTKQLFRIDSETGKLYVKEAGLDREVRLLLAACKTQSYMLEPFCANVFNYLLLFNYFI